MGMDSEKPTVQVTALFPAHGAMPRCGGKAERDGLMPKPHSLANKLSRMHISINAGTTTAVCNLVYSI
jgi:hypothetical protein